MTLVDRHTMFVEAVERPLWQLGYRCTCVVTEGLTIAATLRRVLESRPGVVVASLALGPVDGGKVLSALTEQGCRVISVAEHVDPFRLGEAFARGAYATAPKTTPLDEFVRLVGAAMAAEPVAVRLQHDRDRLVRHYWEDGREQRVLNERLASLSRQERDLLELMMAGVSVPEVAQLRTVGEATVRSQARSILKKLEVSSQLQAVAAARAHGWTPSAHSTRARRHSRPTHLDERPSRQPPGRS